MEHNETQLTLAKGQYLAFLFFCIACIPLVFCILSWTQIFHTTTVGLLLLLIAGVVYFVSELAQEQPANVINERNIYENRSHL